MTSAKIAGAAGLTAASVNFHFGSKEALLIATLREVSEEFSDVTEEVLAAAGDDALKGLLGIIDATLSPELSDSRKVAVWHAFLAESSAREDYQRICGDRDDAFYAAVTRLCTALIEAGARSTVPMPLQCQWVSPVCSISCGRAFCSSVTSSTAKRAGGSAMHTFGACFHGWRTRSRGRPKRRLLGLPRRRRWPTRAFAIRCPRGLSQR